MSFDKIFDLTAGVYFYLSNILFGFAVLRQQHFKCPNELSQVVFGPTSTHINGDILQAFRST